MVYWVLRTDYGLHVSVTQHAMRCAILSSVACTALNIFFLYYIINGTIFEKETIEYKMSVLIVCTNIVCTNIVCTNIDCTNIVCTNILRSKN